MPAYDELEFIQRLTNIYSLSKQARGNLVNEWKRNYRLTMNRASSALPAAAGIRANEVFPTIDHLLHHARGRPVQPLLRGHGHAGRAA
jgi:hypothetical protein